VRYLEKAVFNADLGQLKLVYEALHERAALLRAAPHLTSALPILTPCYAWWEVPFYWTGLKAYDLLAGSQALAPSRYLGAAESARRLPALAARRGGDGKRLKGSVLYYDGQFDDARLNVSLVMTAAAAGAAACNYVEVVGLIKDGTGRVVGARLRDRAPQGARRSPAAPADPVVLVGSGAAAASGGSHGGSGAGGASSALAAYLSRAIEVVGGLLGGGSSSKSADASTSATTTTTTTTSLPPPPAPNGRDVFDVYARSVINATGPFSDGVRRLSAATPRAVDAAAIQREKGRLAARQATQQAALEASEAASRVRDVVLASAGTHVTLPEWYASGGPAILAEGGSGGGGFFSSLFGGGGGDGGRAHGGRHHRPGATTTTPTTTTTADLSQAPHASGASGLPATGLIIPKTRDGRVLFMLPWQGAVIAGTTDEPCPVSARPSATSQEIDFILSSLADYLDVRVRREDVSSAWTGIRPLAADPTAQAKGGSQNVSRDHVLFDEGDGVLTIAGGKWTTYRRMAEDAVDAAVAGMVRAAAAASVSAAGVAPAEDGSAPPSASPSSSLLPKVGPCATRGLRLLGARGDSPAAARVAAASSAAAKAAADGAGAPLPSLPRAGRCWPSGGAPTVAEVAQASAAILGPLPSSGGGGGGDNTAAASSLLAAAATRELGSGAVTPTVARHLASAYGDRAFDVLAAGAESGLGATPLVPGLPFLEAEVLHAARQEACATVADFLARRSRLAFVDASAAAAAAPRVAELLAGELGWSAARRRAEVDAARAFLRQAFAVPPPAAAVSGVAVAAAPSSLAPAAAA
jgi:glycerol-3-phosphate dehydrogenase